MSMGNMEVEPDDVAPAVLEVSPDAGVSTHE